MELGLGLVGMKPRSDVMKELEAERGVLRGRMAELGFNKQSGQMETNVPDYQSPTMPLQAPTQVAPETPAQTTAQPEAPKNFNSLQEAKAAGVKPGQLIYINGKPGRLQARQ